MATIARIPPNFNLHEFDTEVEAEKFLRKFAFEQMGVRPDYTIWETHERTKSARKHVFRQTRYLGRRTTETGRMGRMIANRSGGREGSPYEKDRHGSQIQRQETENAKRCSSRRIGRPGT